MDEREEALPSTAYSQGPNTLSASVSEGLHKFWAETGTVTLGSSQQALKGGKGHVECEPAPRNTPVSLTAQRMAAVRATWQDGSCQKWPVGAAANFLSYDQGQVPAAHRLQP